MGEPRDIRVELTLKTAPEMFRRANSDVAEVFSPPRIAQEAGLRSYGGRVLRPGWSLDLTVRDPESGHAWDFSKEEMRQRARQLVIENKPYVVIGSPPCTAFSHIQNLNKKRPKHIRDRELREGRQHLRFAVELYRLQVLGGRYYLHEHPSLAKSWAEDCITQLAAAPGTMIAECHYCRFGMEAQDELGKGLVKKPTKFLTNSRRLFEKLHVQCVNATVPADQRHRHVHLVGGRAR